MPCMLYNPGVTTKAGLHKEGGHQKQNKKTKQHNKTPETDVGRLGDSRFQEI